MSSNYPDDNPKTVQGEKKIDLSLVPPSAIIAEARVMAIGAHKYGPYNWRDKTVSSRVYTAAALRHILTWQDGEEIDPESGESHLAHARACLGIVIDAKSIGKLNDNRPTAGAAGRLLLPHEPKPTTLAIFTEAGEGIPPHTAMPAEKGGAMPDGMSASHYCVDLGGSVRPGYAAECSACRETIAGLD